MPVLLAPSLFEYTTMPYPSQWAAWQGLPNTSALCRAHQGNSLADDGATTDTMSPLSVKSLSTTQIHPSYDGRQLWITYEGPIGVWCDITDLSPRSMGPALRHSLEGYTSWCTALRSRDLFKGIPRYPRFQHTSQTPFRQGSHRRIRMNMHAINQIPLWPQRHAVLVLAHPRVTKEGSRCEAGFARSEPSS